MRTFIDRDTSNWLFGLAVVGAVLIALYSIFDSTPFLVRAIGNLAVTGALMFLFDIDGGPSYKRMYFSVLAIWIVILLYSGIGFIEVSPAFTQVSQTITFLIYALSLISLPLFAKAMQSLSKSANETDLERDWKNLARFSAVYYCIPIIAFIGTFIGGSLGMEVKLFYGITEGSNVPEDLVKYGVRVLFFVPIALIILGLRKTRNSVISVAP